MKTIKISNFVAITLGLDDALYGGQFTWGKGTLTATPEILREIQGDAKDRANGEYAEEYSPVQKRALLKFASQPI